MAETDLFKWRHCESEIILLCVRWYLRYALSYRDLEEMMNERGLSVDHTTIYRWLSIRNLSKANLSRANLEGANMVDRIVRELWHHLDLPAPIKTMSLMT